MNGFDRCLLDLVGLGVISSHLFENGEGLLEGGIRDLTSDSIGDEVLEFDNGTQTSFDDWIVNIRDCDIPVLNTSSRGRGLEGNGLNKYLFTCN